jgi:hypothetical protein
MDHSSPDLPSAPAAPKHPGSEVHFGMNEVRLSARQWLAAFGLVLLVMLLTPPIWEEVERFETGLDYRIPYSLSKDYWLYGRRLRQVTDPTQIIVLGDSVIWGEYVLPDGTLSHFLDREEGVTNRFINGGVNGLFPLALEGLIEYYGSSLQRRKLLLHCNVLWMTSPKADLSTPKEEPFNHSRLVPQFYPRIPCYRADANERLTAIIQRQVGFVAWVNHLQDAYFGQKSILDWTLADDGGEPPRYPNAGRNPFAQIKLRVPPTPQDDPQRGPGSPRHKPWFTNSAGPSQFDWVPLHSSLQWHAFQRLVELLRERGDDVLVILGPFNEHMIAAENQPAYQELRNGIRAWLSQNQVPYLVPELLPSLLYADASHPLTEGYQLLAEQIHDNQDFQRWLAGSPSRALSVER